MMGTKPLRCACNTILVGKYKQIKMCSKCSKFNDEGTLLRAILNDTRQILQQKENEIEAKDFVISFLEHTRNELESKIKEQPFIPSFDSKLIRTKNKTTCGICTDDIEINDHIYKLNCDHVFHSHCTIQARYYSPLCPICRRVI